jgi:mannose-binding lectin 1
MIAVLVNDGTKSYDHHNDGKTQSQGSCIRDFRNKPFPIRLKIEYVNQTLTVRLHHWQNP